MSYPTRRQFAPLVNPSLTSLAKTYTFSQACVAGNLIVVAYAGDKNTGTLTMSDNVGTDGGANPWTVETSITGASVSLYIARKVAVGGETVVTATIQNTPPVGSTGYAEEMADDGAGAWTVVAKATPTYSDTSRSSAASGTTDTADYDGRALAVGAIDSMSSIGNEAARTLPSFSSPFTKIYTPDWPSGSGGGSAGCYVGTADLASGATTSTTFALNAGADQLTCAIAVFGRVEVAGGPPVVSAGPDATVTLGEQHIQTGEITDANGGTTVVDGGWEIMSGPTNVGDSVDTTGISFTPQVAGEWVFRFWIETEYGTGEDFFTLTAEAALVAPGSMFDLTSWKWQGPIEDPNDPGDLIEVTQPELDTYASPYLYLDEQDDMVFVAPVDGFTTGDSARSELREMENGIEAAWSPYDPDPRSLTVTGYFDPTNVSGGSNPRPEMIIGQIHGTLGSPPLMLAAEYQVATPRIRVFKYNGTSSPGFGNMLSSITPTTLATYRIAYEPGANPAGGTGQIIVSGAFGGPENLPTSGTTNRFVFGVADFFGQDEQWYFKAGAYPKTQAASGATGEGKTTVTRLELIQSGVVEPAGPESGRFFLACA